MASKIAVVFGGVSNESEISVITGTMACNILENGGKEVLPVFISRGGKFYAGEKLSDINTFKDNSYTGCNLALIADGGIYLLNSRGKIKKYIAVDCVLNCCHGGYGEGGGLSGICAAAGLPLAGAGMFESSVFMDKYLTKILLKGLGIKTAPYRYIRQADRHNYGEVEFPAIVKPATLGSSIGIARVDNEEELKAALDCAFTYDSAAIVEKFLENRREINCAAYFSDDEIHVSECEEAVAQGDVLSFEDKYEGGGRSVMPADIPIDASEQIRTITYSVYQKLNMRGIVRFDFIISDDIYLSEVNTVPGSLAYYLFSKSFKEFYGVLDSVLRQAERDFVRSHKTILTTGILKTLPENTVKGTLK